MTRLRGERVVLRPARADDVDALAAILAEAEVARWWVVRDARRTAGEFVESGDHVAFVIEDDGRIVGGIQYYEETDPAYPRAGIDIFLGSEWQGRGLGPDALRVLARYLISERGHHRLVIDPAADNRHAIAAYEKVGFKPVGVMRKYARGLDGAWHDGLLMDLLAEELR